MSKKRPSPDSVLCIDLTEDGSDDEQKVRLGDVRKTLNSGGSISKRIKEEGKQAFGANTSKCDFRNDGVEIVKPKAPPLLPLAQVSSASADDDIEIIGAKNELLLPHLRQDCTRFKFDMSPLNYFSKCYSEATLENNAKCCDLCYCYVCDCPVKDCKSWRSGSGSRVQSLNHCCGNNTLPFWIQQRSLSKTTSCASLPTIQVNETSAAIPTLAGELHSRNECSVFHFDPTSFNSAGRLPFSTLNVNEKCCDLCYCYMCKRPAKQCRLWRSRRVNIRGANHCCFNKNVAYWSRQISGSTVAPPGSAATPAPAQQSVIATISANNACGQDYKEKEPQGPKCRKCGNCFKRCDIFDNDRYWGYHRYYDSEDEEEDDDSCPYGYPPPPEEKDHCQWCGRIALEDFFWKSQAKTRKKDAGDVPLGTKEIPFTIKARDPRRIKYYSHHWRTNEGKAGWEYSEQELEDDIFKHQIGKLPKMQTIASMTRLEATRSKLTNINCILIESEQDADLLQLLRSSPSCEVCASWDSTARRGTFKLSLFLEKRHFDISDHDARWDLILGLWFKSLPQCLSDVIYAPVDEASVGLCSPSNMRNSIDHSTALRTIMDAYIEGRNKKAKTLKLLSSTGQADQGFSCAGDTSFNGLLRRFYSAQLYNENKHLGQWADTLTLFDEGLVFGRQLSEILLGAKISAFLNLSLQPSFRSGTSIEALMTQLENIGHEAHGFVDGLNVELLDFQRQTLQWTLERETMEGGIQTLLWGKVPVGQGRDIYFNPILNRFRRDVPALVRGGFIAEEMGLGKTVISLALILRNPAPVLPESGSSISDLEWITSPTQWDKSLYKKNSTTNKKRGSILCRGTLVICPVSLVGQWIAEARSKLQDPGVVYPYHGQNRKRNAFVLAQNSIVVTTYQVLASDATHHAKKGGEDYCAPLEQVRWWRVICDEGHSLREGQTSRSKAVLSLVADHKWLVSGTPMNTSFGDLKNQFKFLGIEEADKLVSSISGRGRNSEILMGHARFLLGNIMIRHSQKQKYRDTDTTLMSLPNKTERTVTVKFSESEQAEYRDLEKMVQNSYISFRKRHGHEITKHYLKLTQKLMPLRAACSGGRYPLLESIDNESEVGTEDTGDRKKKQVHYSKFEFAGKFRILIDELERIRDSDPSSKSLVFSQFGSTLEWLQKELPNYGFQYRTLKGDMTMSQRAKALNDFQADPPTTIFLLSMRAGAVGINLTQANRVFLMEPCFNPALESQAIGRVHRLGQKRKVEIVRLIQENSVESRLLQFLKHKYGSLSDEEAAADSHQAVGVATATKVGLVGNVTTDNVKMMTDDFDLLFGMENFVEDMEIGRYECLSDNILSTSEGFV